ncbi:hypothetical protein [Priestia sp. YIM B13490]|uniref:hypothetical protein n=1 Tax=Priestia sp. YIM B13490 TaxID=3366310 RepID=UPI00366A6168
MENIMKKNLKEGKDIVEDFSKDFDQFIIDTAEENTLQIVLRGHLYIEREITTFLELALKEPQEVITERTFYGNKLSLAYALGILSKDDKISCKNLGEIRNSYAHKWGFEVKEVDFDKLVSSFKGDLKKHYELFRNPNHSLAARLAAAIGVMFLHLRLLIEKYKNSKELESIIINIGETEMQRMLLNKENRELVKYIGENYKL